MIWSRASEDSDDRGSGTKYLGAVVCGEAARDELAGGLCGEELLSDAWLEGEEGKIVVKTVEVTVAVVRVLMLVGALVTVSVRPCVIVAMVLLVTEVMMR